MKFLLDVLVLSIHTHFENLVSFTDGYTENYKRKYIPWLIFDEFAENFEYLEYNMQLYHIMQNNFQQKERLISF